MRTKVRILAIATLALAAGQAVATERWSEMESCVLDAPGGIHSAEALCGTLEVAENPADPDGRQLDLAWAVVPARGRAASDPLFFLAGGPGQSARDMLPLMKAVLREASRERDLVFLDQRGTGGSNALDCDFETMEAFAEPDDWEELEARVRECKADWDADVRFYTTTDAARDLEALREHIGAERINLLGGSYGTRLAQVYLRNHPDRVRSVILDGVVPTRLALGSEHAESLDNALERLFEACRDDGDCAERFPELSESFAELKSRYREESRSIVIDDPRTGEPRDIEFDRDTLAGALRFLAYQPESQMMIPYLIDEAVNRDDPSRLASQMLMVTDQMDEMIAFGLNLTVGCSEDWGHWPDTDAGDTLLGNSMRDFYRQFCQWWPAGDAPADFHEPFDSEVPILLLSGELDPVTPPEYGAEAAEQFTESRHLVATGRGHIVVTNRCMAGIAAQFLASADPDDPDTSCMDRMGPEPFFLNLLGPRP